MKAKMTSWTKTRTSKLKFKNFQRLPKYQQRSRNFYLWLFYWINYTIMTTIKRKTKTNQLHNVLVKFELKKAHCIK